MRRPLVPDHDLHLRLSFEEWAAVREVAERVRMPVSAAVRLLVLRGLDREAVEPSTAGARRGGGQRAPDGRDAYQVGLATLLAAEHTMLVLQEVLHDGASKAARLEEQAGVAAHRRLARLVAASELEDGR